MKTVECRRALVHRLDACSAGRMARLLLVGALALLAVSCANASAQPTSASLQVKVVPIPVEPRAAHSASYPGTGDVLGEGAAFEGALEIRGDEYGGFPPPLTSFSIVAPAGVQLHPQGFPPCPQAILESHEVSHCPKRSALTSVGSVSGVVSFGSTRVHETLAVQAFFAEAGRIAFYAEGTSPALVEVLGSGKIATSHGAGPEFEAAVPLVETVPEAPYAVVQSVHLRLGAAYKLGSKLIPYVRLPRHCGRGGLPIRMRLGFLIGAPVQIDTKLPCPARH